MVLHGVPTQAVEHQQDHGVGGPRELGDPGVVGPSEQRRNHARDGRAVERGQHRIHVVSVRPRGAGTGPAALCRASMGA